MSTAIVWFRNDLRLHDHPALSTALMQHEYVIPVFIFDRKILHGRHGSSNRNRFLLQSIEDLKSSLQKAGADLIIRDGSPEEELIRLAQETNASSVFISRDVTPYAQKRDKRVEEALIHKQIELKTFPGRLIIDSLTEVTSSSGTPLKVFTPFWRAWSKQSRRPVFDAPAAIPLPAGIYSASLPALDSLVDKSELSPGALVGGESAARERLADFLESGIDFYTERNEEPGKNGTSRLSSYLHFGCISPREIEDRLPDSEGARAFHRQLAWRDFYQYILFHFPSNAVQAMQESFRNIQWNNNAVFLSAWQNGRTGYPIVDAAMRQLKNEGWMHNRSRLIVGSFIVKDLGLDWARGERHFMKWLIDGDEANNNGNWQWIASVGVDPAPMYRRFYNPILQQKRYDPKGIYVRTHVPELKNVPDEFLAEPWKMNDEQQKQSGCTIGRDYPAPIVDHSAVREETFARYNQAKSQSS